MTLEELLKKVKELVDDGYGSSRVFVFDAPHMLFSSVNAINVDKGSGNRNILIHI